MTCQHRAPPFQAPCCQEQEEAISRSSWDERCAEILRRNAVQYTNTEIIALIETTTGKRFSMSVVSRKRAALGIDLPRRNQWSGPLRKAYLKARTCSLREDPASKRKAE